MRNMMLGIVFFMGLGAAGMAQSAAGTEPEATKRFPFQTVKIEYAYYGMIEGEETLFIDENGARMAVVSELSIGGYPEEKTYIWKNGRIAVVDHAAAERIQNTSRVSKAPPTFQPLREDSLLAQGYRYSGEEEVAGMPCRRFEKQEKDSIWKIWVWEGIELKRYLQNVNRESYTREARKVAVGAEIPPDIFDIAASDEVR